MKVTLMIFFFFFYFKGLVHQKMKILSSFTHPQVVSNLYVFIFSAVHKGRYLEECFNQTDLIPYWLHSREKYIW